MKKILALLALSVFVLGGCALNPSSLDAVRVDAWLRAERRLPMTSYAQVQKALLDHARLCGSAPDFALLSHSPNEATLTYALDDPPQRQRTVLIDLRQIMNRDGFHIVAQAYASPRLGQDVVGRVFAAVLDPETCSAP